MSLFVDKIKIYYNIVSRKWILMKCINDKNKKRILSEILGINSVFNVFLDDSYDDKCELPYNINQYQDANYISKKKMLRKNNKKLKSNTKRK